MTRRRSRREIEQAVEDLETAGTPEKLERDVSAEFVTYTAGACSQGADSMFVVVDEDDLDTADRDAAEERD